MLGHLDELVLKPVDGAGGSGIVIGPRADEATLGTLRAQVTAQPRSWIAQQPVALSTSPVLIGESLAPRHIDLRPFAVNDGNDVWLLPGGLTRVALPEGELVVNSSRGGGSKDTWVLVPPGEPDPHGVAGLADSVADQTALAVAGQPGPPGPPGPPVMAPPPLPHDQQVSRQSGPPMEDQQQ